jgi:hypothetical protein
MGSRLVVFVDASDGFFDEKFRLWTWRKDISRYCELKTPEFALSCNECNWFSLNAPVKHSTIAVDEFSWN